ncbi:GNAT family N-acetyltransferase [Aquimarina megaterium]|uniref:GNAT family N-acetyltransferase n=1 Tax=Aquimarina megaterium TaxID=1443666 RepID=UPI000471E096|nr:GNAT family N-acetyltransferase [Aquimarina megaterium]
MKSPEIHIRPANKKDLEAIWSLWKVVVDQKIYFPYDDSFSREHIENSWINLNNNCFVAELEKEIIGAYILKPNQPGYGNHIANASYMVDSQKRGMGLGHQLCAHSIDAAKELGYYAMQFNLVVSTNAAAIKVWLANGFEIIGTIPGGFKHFEKGYVDAHVFYRKL